MRPKFIANIDVRGCFSRQDVQFMPFQIQSRSGVELRKMPQSVRFTSPDHRVFIASRGRLGELMVWQGPEGMAGRCPKLEPAKNNPKGGAASAATALGWPARQPALLIGPSLPSAFIRCSVAAKIFRGWELPPQLERGRGAQRCSTATPIGAGTVWGKPARRPAPLTGPLLPVPFVCSSVSANDETPPKKT